MGHENKTPPPLTPAAAKAAIEKSGYPFETLVLEALADGLPRPFLPFPGFRSETGRDDGTTKEIDAVVDLPVGVGRADGNRIVNLVCFVEARRMHDAAFVGFFPPERTGLMPSWTSLRLSAMGGLPHWGVGGSPVDVSPVHRAIDTPGGLSDSLAPLASAERCIQWAVVRRHERHDFKADQDAAWANDLVGTLRAATWQMRKYVRTAKENWGNPPTTMAMLSAVPILVVDGPLYTYRVRDSALVPTDWFTLRIPADTIVGARNGAVDVVTLEGLKRLTRALHESLTRLARFLADDDATAPYRSVAAFQRNLEDKT